MTMKSARFLVLVALFAPVLARAAALPAEPEGLTRIGIAAAVRGAVNATTPGQPVGRVIESGKPLYLNDHVTTGPDSRMQILLLDETTFTIGPNSDMVLDEFVYDPKTNAGHVSARILAGVFRFVTGKIARRRPQDMNVRLAVATIGIRGTMVAGHVDGHNAEIVLIGPGPQNNAQERPGGITVGNSAGHVDINSSGWGTTITDNGAPSRPFRFTPGQLEGILGELSPHHTASNGGGPGDPSRNSGQGLAGGNVTYRDWQNLGDLNANVQQLGTFVAQQGGSPQNTWNDLLQIQSGFVGYGATGSFTCAGGGCVPILGANSGTWNFGFNVDFANKQIVGLSPSIKIGSDAMSMNTISYANLGGKAVITLTAADVPAGIFGTVYGSTIQFLRAGGQNAGAAQVNLIYNIYPVNGGGTATGSAKAPVGPFLIGG